MVQGRRNYSYMAKQIFSVFLIDSDTMGALLQLQHGTVIRAASHQQHSARIPLQGWQRQKSNESGHKSWFKWTKRDISLGRIGRSTLSLPLLRYAGLPGRQPVRRPARLSLDLPQQLWISISWQQKSCSSTFQKLFANWHQSDCPRVRWFTNGPCR